MVYPEYVDDLDAALPGILGELDKLKKTTCERVRLYEHPDSLERCVGGWAEPVRARESELVLLLRSEVGLALSVLRSPLPASAHAHTHNSVRRTAP